MAAEAEAREPWHQWRHVQSWNGIFHGLDLSVTNSTSFPTIPHACGICCTIKRSQNLGLLIGIVGNSTDERTDESSCRISWNNLPPASASSLCPCYSVLTTTCCSLNSAQLFRNYAKYLMLFRLFISPFLLCILQFTFHIHTHFWLNSDKLSFLCSTWRLEIFEPYIS